MRWCGNLSVWTTQRIESLGPSLWERYAPGQSVQTKIVVLQQYRNESFWCSRSSVNCWLSNTEINSSEGEGWQGFQRKERRLEGESEMGSTVICIQQDASNLSKNYQKLNKTLNPRAIADSLFLSQRRTSCAEASPSILLFYPAGGSLWPLTCQPFNKNRRCR